MAPSTPLPWQVDDDFRILDAAGESIIAPTECDAMLGECYQAEDAAYIVHACNRYPELVAALRAIRQRWIDGVALTDGDAEIATAALARLGSE